ncbi:PIN domain-containing protein [Brevundimonas staleyi]|uniref:PIN domain-containing protein n=1 Tax=Brevundimonas staleyi TaxID=74326 RepID=A0ABW0FZJ0_9CAUL
MIAADSSILIDAMQGLTGARIQLLHDAIRTDMLRLPPPVVTEILSFPRAAIGLSQFGAYKQLDIEAGFWERAAASRRALLERGLKAKLADALIAQCCIDANVPLLSHDTDFRHFETHCGLKLAL